MQLLTTLIFGPALGFLITNDWDYLTMMWANADSDGSATAYLAFGSGYFLIGGFKFVTAPFILFSNLIGLTFG